MGKKTSSDVRVISRIINRSGRKGAECKGAGGVTDSGTLFRVSISVFLNGTLNLGHDSA